MAGVVKNSLLIAILFYAFHTHAATKLSISDLRKNVRSQDRVLKRLNKRIVSLERSLSKNNTNYIKVLESKRQIEDQMYRSQEKITKYIELVKEEKTKTKKILGSVVANSMTDDETSADLLSKKILTQSLSKKLLKLKSLENVLTIKKLKIDEMRNQFLAREKEELTVLRIINDLENRKKEYAAQYVKVESERSKLNAKIATIKSSLSMKKRKKKSKVKRPALGMTFSSPLDQYSGVEYDKKGIYFKFSKRQPISSPKSGKVAYVGSLANYGNVIMIDHGKQTRTVFLGAMNVKTKKGAFIKKGQIVGYTQLNSSSKDLGKLYFEVRKKNVAQNTFLLMDKQFLAKNNLESINI